MDVLSTAFGQINLSSNISSNNISSDISSNISLKNDVAIIMDGWKRMDDRLSLRNLMIRPGEFESLSSLYEALCAHIKDVSIIDIMPYIDDYMEYYETITNTL